MSCSTNQPTRTKSEKKSFQLVLNEQIPQQNKTKNARPSTYCEMQGVSRPCHQSTESPAAIFFLLELWKTAGCGHWRGGKSERVYRSVTALEGSTGLSQLWKVLQVCHSSRRFYRSVTALEGSTGLSQLWKVLQVCHSSRRFYRSVTALEGSTGLSQLWKVLQVCHSFGRVYRSVTALESSTGLSQL